MMFNWETIIETVTIFAILGGIVSAFILDYKYILISAFFIVVFLYLRKKKKERLIKYYRDKFREQWGKEHIEKRDILSSRKLYDFLEKEREGKFTIDDITWLDLNMDSVFNKIDHTKSMPGMNYLYNILRNPVFNKGELIERNKWINLLLENKTISQEIQSLLSILGKKEGKEVFTYFKDGLNVKTNNLFLYRILSYLSYFSIVMLVINRKFGFTMFISIMSINAFIYQDNKNRIAGETEIFKYIGNLFTCAKNIVKIDNPGIYMEQESLKRLLKDTNKIYKNISSLNNNINANMEIQILLDYINMITLKETIIFYKTINLVNRHKDQIFEMYKIIGKIDAYISIASYKDGLDYYTEPNLLDTNYKFYLETKDIYHPLLENPVAYTFKLDNKGALVTGSNASGKSTYLRTIGVNALFAQTLYIVLAKDYSANYFRLLTSIGTTDSIEDGDSYFMTEAKSLKRIIDILDKNQPVLCILDEIFRGTNTIERINAAREVLNYMIDRNSLVVAATHDLELTTMVNDRFHNYHFQEDIRENDIEFDYILRKGPATSRNAIAILRYLGYPKEIHESADKEVEKYESEQKGYQMTSSKKILGKF